MRATLVCVFLVALWSSFAAAAETAPGGALLSTSVVGLMGPVGSSSPLQSAICIDPSGLFLCHGVSKVGTGQTVSLLPAAGQFRDFSATVVRSDATSSLTLLRVTEPGRFAAVRLAPAELQLEQRPATLRRTNIKSHQSSSFAGEELSVPTTVKHLAGDNLQFNLPQRAFGAESALLDSEGRLIGIAQIYMGTMGATIPVATIHRSLQMPKIDFRASAIPFAKLHAANTFEIGVTQFDREAGKYEVTLELLNTRGGTVIAKAVQRRPELFEATIVPNVDSGQPAPQALAYKVRVLRNGVPVGTLPGVLGISASGDKRPEDRAFLARQAAESTRPPTGVLPEVVEVGKPITQILRGGSGRYLFLLTEGDKQISVFDFSTATIAARLAVPSNVAFVAAGATKLIAVLPDQRIVQRWDLATMKRDMVRELPEGARIFAVSMGYASEGPILVARASGADFLDSRTLTPLGITVPEIGMGSWRPQLQNKFAVTAAATGDVFAARQGPSAPSGIRLLQLIGNVAEVSYQHIDVKFLLPSFDGSMIFADTGLYDAGTITALDAEALRDLRCLPSLDGGYFVGALSADTRRATTPHTTYSIYSANERQVLFPLPPLEEVSGIPARPSNESEALNLENRIFFNAAAQLLVTIPDDRKSLRIRHCNPVEMLRNAGLDYLYVASRPRTVIRAGDNFMYQVDAKSMAGTITYRLRSGPPEMTVATDGIVKWLVPRRAKASVADVKIEITDSSGHSLVHAFKVNVIPAETTGN